MQQLLKMTRDLSSPAALLAAVWCVVLISVAVGPIDFPQQPSVPVLVLVATGVSLFVVGQFAGGWSGRAWLHFWPNLPTPPARTTNIAVVACSIVGLAGIAMIALDRLVLSGISNSGFSELLRCASVLIDLIEIKRTPVLYAGYLTFSFGSVALVLFLLKGEEIHGWTAVLAQLSILSPIGYALIYAGRMPIMFVIVLVIAVMLVRIRQGRRPLPQGHHLLVKTIALVVLFGIYANAQWSSRRNFCIQMNGLVQQLRAKQSEAAPAAANRPRNTIDAADLSRMIQAAEALPRGGEFQYSADTFPLQKREAWHIGPRGYVLRAVKSGWLPARTASNLLNTYFYLVHGVFVLDLVWRARAEFSPQWGLYEIGVLSPILRVFFPRGEQLPSMVAELKAAQIHGSFPTVWAAAYIDFGVLGAIIYILIWGFVGGWSSVAARHSQLATPALLLSFVFASILMSPVQGPLGTANSALILASMVIVGIAVDFGSLRARDRRTVPAAAKGPLGEIGN